MWKNVIQFLEANGLDILLVIVGASAFITYWLQERRKISEAASLIILQVEDLQKHIAEIGSFIVDGKLNDSAFYESRMIFKTDYWDEYKHYFIRKMDSFSFNSFDEFYNCASEILEQQQFMKNMQKNSMFLTQQTIMQMEANSIIQSFSTCEQKPVDIQQLSNVLKCTIPQEMEPEQKVALDNTLMRIIASNKDVNQSDFWKVYGKSKNNIEAAINQNAFTPYIPTQIRITLEKALRKYNAIQVIGCNGYRKLKKIAGRKF
ncbi:MAG: hypothetical protein ACI4GD_03055 [Lachnospiraceae bacterium]